MAETADTKAEPAPGISPEEDAPPTTLPASSEELGEDTAADLQLEPTQEDMERERLNARAEQVMTRLVRAGEAEGIIACVVSANSVWPVHVSCFSLWFSMLALSVSPKYPNDHIQGLGQQKMDA